MGGGSMIEYRFSLDESQKQHILQALARTDGVIDGPNVLRSRMKKLGITT